MQLPSEEWCLPALDFRWRIEEFFQSVKAALTKKLQAGQR
jgi:hypothetical protein